MEFTIRFDTFSRLLMTPLGMGKGLSGVRLDADTVHVRMGWGFRATFARSAIAGVTPAPRVLLTRGVHGWRGRWLVNGSRDGLVAITLEPVQRARVLGWPVRLRQLTVGVDDPEGLIEALAVQ